MKSKKYPDIFTDWCMRWRLIVNCASLNFKKLCILEDETFTKINSNSELGNEEIYTVRIYKLLSNS